MSFQSSNNNQTSLPEDDSSKSQPTSQVLRKTLQSSNQFLITQIDKNKKYIKSLSNFLAWISSCPETVTPELTSLMLSNNEVQSQFDFELKLVNDFNKCICKSKYFCFIVELVPINLVQLPATQQIPLEVKLYTSEQLPRQITTTMQGKHVTRGKGVEYMNFNSNEEKFLARIKMQINEVSSHFVNGTINLVVAKASYCGINIKSLVIKDIIVKAKEKTCKRWRESMV